MNSLFFLGIIKGHTTKKTYFIWEKKVIFNFFDGRRYYQYSHRQQQLMVGGWYWPAQPHLGLMCTVSLEDQQRNSRATSALLLPDPTPAGSADEMSIAGFAGQTTSWSGEEGQGSTRSDCLPPLTSAAPPAPEHLQTALPFLLGWLCHLSAPVTDTKSWSLLGSVAEEVIKNCIAPYVMKHALLSAARCDQLGSIWDLQAWCVLIPLCCHGLLTKEYWHRGPFRSLLHGDQVTPGQTSCWLSISHLLSCWVHGPEGLNVSSVLL